MERPLNKADVASEDRHNSTKARRQTVSNRRAHVLVYVLLVSISALFLLPLFWMITSALKPNYQVLAFPPVWIPNPPKWSNFREALTYVPFGRFSINTVIIALGTIVGTVLSCTVVAYGFARLRAPGKNALFVVLLATMMLPYPVTMIPLYVEFNQVGWVNTFLPLIVPAFFGVPFYIFLLRQFFMGIPTEFEDAARIDGANTLQILWHVILPMSKPALATVAILTFQATWNDFLPPLIYLHDQSKYTDLAGPQLLPQHLHDQLGLSDGGLAGDDATGGAAFLPRPAAVHPGYHVDRHQGLNCRSHNRVARESIRRPTFPVSRLIFCCLRGRRASLSPRPCPAARRSFVPIPATNHRPGPVVPIVVCSGSLVVCLR